MRVLDRLEPSVERGRPGAHRRCELVLPQRGLGLGTDGESHGLRFVFTRKADRPDGRGHAPSRRRADPDIALDALLAVISHCHPQIAIDGAAGSAPRRHDRDRRRDTQRELRHHGHFDPFFSLEPRPLVAVLHRARQRDIRAVKSQRHQRQEWGGPEWKTERGVGLELIARGIRQALPVRLCRLRV